MKKLLPAGLLATLLLPSVAQATAWEAKTMRAPMSAREVERPLKMNKGWLELGLGTDVKQSQGYWSAEGEAVDFESAEFLYTTEYLRIRYGFSPRIEFWWQAPVHYIRLQNPALGTDTDGMYLGDPRFGLRYELYRTDAPLTSVVGEIEMKVPAGNEVPGSYIAGPATFQNFVTTTGTPDLRLGASGKRQFGIFAVQGGGHFTHRFSGMAGYLIETDYNQFNARIKPGWELDADVSGTVQLGPVALRAGGWAETHSAVRIGTTSPGLFPDQNLEEVEGSDGSSYGLEGGLTLSATRSLDLVAGVSHPLGGEDLMFFPIEDLHPTRGTTWSGSLEFRF